MPDGASRVSIDAQKIHHYMGCSTFANFTVLPEIAVAKIREDARFDKVCYVGSGVTTDLGAVIKTAKIEPGAQIVDWYMRGKIAIDPMITYTMPLDDIDKAFALLREGKSIRNVVVY